MATNSTVPNVTPEHNTFWLSVGQSIYDLDPRRVQLPGRDLFRQLRREATEGPREKKGRYLSGQILKTHARRGRNTTVDDVDAVGCIVLEVDGADVQTLEQWSALFPFEQIAYTTWSHGIKPGLSARTIIPLTRPLTPVEARAVIGYLTDLASEQSGLEGVVAPECADGYRLWFFPRTNPDAVASPHIIHKPGPALNPDNLPGGASLHALVDKQAQVEAHTVAVQPRINIKVQTHGLSPMQLSGVRTALQEEVSAVANAQDGNRTNRLYASAANLGELVAGGLLQEADARANLEHAALQCGLRSYEIRRQIDRGLEQGARNPRTLEHLAHKSALQCTPGRSTATRRLFTLEEARARTLEIMHSALQERRAVLLKASVGVGKSHSKLDLHNRYLAHPDGALRLIVEKDRKSAVRAWTELQRRAFLVLGRAGSPVGIGETFAPGPDLGIDNLAWVTCGNAKALELSRQGKSAGAACRQCRLKSICAPESKPYTPDQHLGTAGMWQGAKQAMREGGVIVCLEAHARRILEEYSGLDPSERAPLASVVFDDVADTTPAKVTPRQIEELQTFLESTYRSNTPEYRALEALQAAMRAAQNMVAESEDETKRAHGVHLGDKACALLSHVDAEALSTALKADNAPFALRDLARVLTGDALNPVDIYVESNGVSLEIWPTPYKIPDDCAVIISTATGQEPIWSAFINRELETHRIDVEPRRLRAKLTATHSSSFNPSALRAPQRIIDAAHAIGRWARSEVETTAEANKTIPGELRVLLVTHKALIESPHWADIESALCKEAGINPIKSSSIHWRGVLQVGSNVYRGHEVVITLGDPRNNLGAHRARIWACEKLSGRQIDEKASYATDTAGWVEQAHGRNRWSLGSCDSLHIHAGHNPAPTLLQKATVQPIKRKVRDSLKINAARDWLKSVPGGGVSRVLAKHPDSPTESTLRRVWKADPRPSWKLEHKLGRRFSVADWKADDLEQALQSARYLAKALGEDPSTVRSAEKAPIPTMTEPLCVHESAYIYKADSWTHKEPVSDGIGTSVQQKSATPIQEQASPPTGYALKQSYHSDHSIRSKPVYPPCPSPSGWQTIAALSKRAPRQKVFIPEAIPRLVRALAHSMGEPNTPEGIARAIGRSSVEVIARWGVEAGELIDRYGLSSQYAVDDIDSVSA